MWNYCGKYNLNSEEVLGYLNQNSKESYRLGSVLNNEIIVLLNEKYLDQIEKNKERELKYMEINKRLPPIIITTIPHVPTKNKKKYFDPSIKLNIEKGEPIQKNNLLKEEKIKLEKERIKEEIYINKDNPSIEAKSKRIKNKSYRPTNAKNIKEPARVTKEKYRLRNTDIKFIVDEWGRFLYYSKNHFGCWMKHEKVKMAIREASKKIKSAKKQL